MGTRQWRGADLGGVCRNLQKRRTAVERFGPSERRGSLILSPREHGGSEARREKWFSNMPVVLDRERMITPFRLFLSLQAHRQMGHITFKKVRLPSVRERQSRLRSMTSTYKRPPTPEHWSLN